MTKLKKWLNFVGFLALDCTIFLTYPSKATSANNQQMLKLGLIDKSRANVEVNNYKELVNTLEQSELDYQTPQLIAGLVDSIREAGDAAQTQMTDDIQVAIPLGEDSSFDSSLFSGYQQYSRLANKAKQKISHFHSDTPIRFPLDFYQYVALNNIQIHSSQSLEAIGFINRRGNFTALTVKELYQMFYIYFEKIRVATLTPQNIISPSTRDEFLTTSSSTEQVIDLIALNKKTGQISELTDFNIIFLFKDALNAALKSKVKTHNVDLQALQSSMRLNRQSF